MKYNIKVIDHLSPENTAMLQALYSRSVESVDTHLSTVDKKGSCDFMSTYYVGYGHKSIAQCGTTTIFIEGVSELAAKAIQDCSLYNGQQTSTRYVDMSKTGLVNPLNNNAGLSVLHEWMNFYNMVLSRLIEHYTNTNIKPDNVSDKVWTNTIQAKAFDVARGFLPASCKTQLSFHTTLDNANNQIARLLAHPLKEVQLIALDIHNALSEVYPNSIQPIQNNDYLNIFAYDMDISIDERGIPFLVADESFIQFSKDELHSYQIDYLNHREKYSPVDRHVMPFHQVEYSSYLDYASYRDLQRHRSGYISMPLLSPYLGIHPWYIQQLNECGLGLFTTSFLAAMNKQIMALTDDELIRQYYCPLGYMVKFSMNYNLGSLIYLCELRSGKTVHPSLRGWTHQLIEKIEHKYPKMKWFVDKGESQLTVKRGTQTIDRIPANENEIKSTTTINL